MSNVYFDSLRIKVNQQIKEIDATNPESHSIEWFLLKYLNRIVIKTDPPSQLGQVEGSIRSLVRFYVDNVEEKSELGDKFTRNIQEN